MNLHEQIANYILGNVKPHQLIDIGEAALLAGYDTPSLAILAGEPTGPSYNPANVNYYFLQALDELEITLPTKKQAAVTLIRFYLNQLLTGVMTPRDALDQLYQIDSHHGVVPNRKMIGEHFNISHLLGIYFAYDDLVEPFIEHDGRPVTHKEAIQILDQQAIEAAHAYLAKTNG